jgi:urease accessory protein
MNARSYKGSNLKLCVASAALALAPLLADAHPFHGKVGGMAAGLSHPFLGVDHILAMVAVGIWATQLGGKSLWVVPASFVGVMLVGGSFGMAGIRLPMAETWIAASILALGVLIAAAIRLPASASAAVVGLFALFHGHAHGAEIPAAASGIAYAIGFVAATALLHAVGIAFGLVAKQKLPAPAIRYAGAAIVLAGICLCLG